MDGIVIRELTPADRAAVAFSLRRLGDRSRYQRFLRTDSWIPTSELRRLAGVDHWHHEALIAFSPRPRTPIGLVEYVRLEPFDLAELAVTVADGWQRQGVGRELVRALRTRAMAAGIRRFRATIMRGNRGALALARELGRCAILSSDGTTADWLVQLPSGLRDHDRGHPGGSNAKADDHHCKHPARPGRAAGCQVVHRPRVAARRI